LLNVPCVAIFSNALYALAEVLHLCVALCATCIICLTRDVWNDGLGNSSIVIDGVSITICFSVFIILGHIPLFGCIRQFPINILGISSAFMILTRFELIIVGLLFRCVSILISRKAKV